MTLPRIPSFETILERLPRIFDGVDNQAYCTRASTAKTIAVLFYAGAIHGQDRWIRPSQVTEMSDDQLALQSDTEREAWCQLTLSNRRRPRPLGAWYAPNSREQIRDENLRQGLIPNGAAHERPGLPTTTSLPKYSMYADFANLFDETLSGVDLDTAIDSWRSAHLSHGARSRALLRARGVTASSARVQVAFPNGAVHVLAPGPSSDISKAVVEDFAHRFLEDPAVLWLSESAVKVLDDGLATMLGLTIDPARALPDIILVDAGVQGGGVLVVFVEVVNSDGPVNQVRRDTLEALARDAGFNTSDIVYVTAYADRASPAYRSNINSLAWDSFVWFASEPDCVVSLRRGTARKLSTLK
ncbi:MAG: restriction endonuclease [Burkholderiales bacterium]|nr:restriction endonuclease [Burkholderiales bacterium]